MSPRDLGVAAAVAAAALALAAHARSQRSSRAEVPEVDPYTLGEPEAMERAGYESFGPFLWGDDHASADIEHVLGAEVPLLWVETAHFRIGSALPPYGIPRGDREERDKLRTELETLHEKLPRVDPRTRKLDRWLRLHLTAQRVEEVYDDFSRRLGVERADFPRERGELVDGRYMGEGPYLGQPGKYLVLLLEKESSAGHYMRTFLGREQKGTMRWNFFDAGSLLYLSAAEFGDGSLQDDTALHCEAAFNIAMNLLDGYRFYRFQMPYWFRQGLAHWYLRRVSPKHNIYEERRRFDNDPEMRWNWAPRVRARAGFEHFPEAADLLEWEEEGHESIVDQMMLWSRVDYLMSLGNEGFRTYVDVMKDIPFEDGVPTREEILARQRRALEEAWGLDARTFDERWRRWVLESYPKN